MREGQRLLFYLHVFIGAYQVPVNVLNLGNGADHLLAKGMLGNLLIIFGLHHQAAVDGGAKALQQMLPDRGAKIRTQSWVQGIETVTGSYAVILKAHRKCGAG